MKSKKLLAENITKAFRQFTGGLNIQINDKFWLELKNTPEVNILLKARNMGTLHSVTIDENKKIIEIETINKKGNKKNEAIKRYYTPS